MSRVPNIVVLLSDQHSRDVVGCYGNHIVKTPNLDALAARGTRFAKAYCNAPICVPSRASLATGLHIHEIPSWDNADPYHGQRTSFMHRARAAGADTVSIGKLHFRSSDDDNGFDEEIAPMHVAGGTGTFTSLLRDELPRVTSAGDLIRNAGPGISSYTRYDAEIRDSAVAWLESRAASGSRKPFLLFVSFTNPHPPFVAPPDLFELYRRAGLPPPVAFGRGVRPEHPGLAGFRRYFDLEDGFTPEQIRAVTAAYYANVTAMDANVGAVLDTMAATGLGADTLVIYASDHGESLGSKGLFSKCNMYEQSIGVPIIAAGPGIPAGRVSETPAQLLDIYPTVVDALEPPPAESDTRRTGRSLRALANEPDQQRWILAQQHSAGTTAGLFALTDGHTKLVRHLDAPDMLFDLDADPDELDDLGADTAATAPLRNRLESLIDTAAADRAAKASQARRIAAAGGVTAILARGNSGYSPVPGHT